MSSARHKTVAHMHRMLAATTALGCSRAADVNSVTITPLPTVPAPSDSPTPPPPPTVTPTVTPLATVTAPPDPSGYLVVDMMPAPARCLGLAGATHVTGQFTKASGALVLQVVVTLPSSGKLAGTKFDGTSSAWSGQVITTNFRNHNTMVVARLKPASTTSGTMGMTLGVACGAAGNGTLGVTAIFNGTPVDGMIPALSLQDY